MNNEKSLFATKIPDKHCIIKTKNYELHLTVQDDMVIIAKWNSKLLEPIIIDASEYGKPIKGCPSE